MKCSCHSNMDTELSIILLGNTGVGKSAAGNTILGQSVFPSKASFQPVTTRIREETVQVFGKQVRVIDTPGILESEEVIQSQKLLQLNSEQQVKTFCQDVLHFLKSEESAETFCQHHLHSSTHPLFLVVVRVDQFSEKDRKAVEAAIRFVGHQNLRKTYLLFTHGDALKHRTLDDLIHEKSSLQKVVDNFEGRYHLFNNKDGGQEQAEELLQKLFQDVFASPAGPVQPVWLDYRRIVLIGRLGGGKSSAGNTILGSERFKTGCGFNSVSSECVSETAKVEGRQITVVDAPGFTDEVLTLEQLYLQIMKSLMKASPGPHAFVIVVRISKISAADKKLFELLPTVFGSDASKYIMVLFTHGDELRGRSMDDLIQSNTCVSELVSMCGGRFCVFDNTKRGNRQQVREFLRRVVDMVEANGGGHCTSEMFRLVQTIIRKERNRSDQSADSGPLDPPFDRTAGDRSEPGQEKRVQKKLKPFLLGLVVAVLLGFILGVTVGLEVNLVTGVLGGLLVGGTAGVVTTVLVSKRKLFS